MYERQFIIELEVEKFISIDGKVEWRIIGFTNTAETCDLAQFDTADEVFTYIKNISVRHIAFTETDMREVYKTNPPIYLIK